MYEDQHGYTYVLLTTKSARKVLGPYKGKPLPLLRWSSVNGDTYTTFTAGSSSFTIHGRQDTKSNVITEELLSVVIDDVQDVLLAGLEEYHWEGWNTFTHEWEPQARPRPHTWTGNAWQALTWMDE